MENDDVLITKEVRDEYINALYNSMAGQYRSMSDFKIAHPKEYHVIVSAYEKRCALKDCVNAIECVGLTPLFGALTYDNEHITSVENMRKQAIRHLNKCFRVWVMVEEYGSVNNRYHVHFIGAYKTKDSFEDFKGWHSSQNIKVIKDTKKTIRYLTNYMAKSVPRVRRSKGMIELVKADKKRRKWINLGFDCLAEEHENEMCRVASVVAF